MATMNVSVVSPGVKKVSWNFNEKNTVTIEFCNELSKIMTELEQDKSTLAVLFEGNGNFFSNGFEPSSFHGSTTDEVASVIDSAFGLCLRIFKADFIAISAMNGHAMGFGAIFALFSDYRLIQNQKARFGFPEILIGLALPMATSIRLQHIIGPIKTRDLGQTGKALKPDQAVEMGLIDHSCEAEQLSEQALKILNPFIKGSWQAVRSNKRSINQPWFAMLDEAHKQDVIVAPKLILSADGQEGMSSILEGRRAVFSNNT